jgi:hypothetical protein
MIPDLWRSSLCSVWKLIEAQAGEPLIPYMISLAEFPISQNFILRLCSLEGITES